MENYHMMIRSIKTDVNYNHQTISHGGAQYTIPSHNPDIMATVELILDTKEYETLMQSFKNSYSGAISDNVNYNNIKFANFVTNTITADIIESNKYNEDFLLSLLNGTVSVIVDGTDVTFKHYAITRLPEFAEKYKLLLNE